MINTVVNKIYMLFLMPKNLLIRFIESNVKIVIRLTNL